VDVQDAVAKRHRPGARVSIVVGLPIVVVFAPPSRMIVRRVLVVMIRAVRAVRGLLGEGRSHGRAA
jgi:hypothetical protein